MMMSSHAGGHRLFDAVLDDGLIYQSQHLLGDGLGGGQERVPSPAAGKTALRTFLFMKFLGVLRGYGNARAIRDMTSYCDRLYGRSKQQAGSCPEVHHAVHAISERRGESRRALPGGRSRWAEIPAQEFVVEFLQTRSFAPCFF